MSHDRYGLENFMLGLSYHACTLRLYTWIRSSPRRQSYYIMYIARIRICVLDPLNGKLFITPLYRCILNIFICIYCVAVFYIGRIHLHVIISVSRTIFFLYTQVEKFKDFLATLLSRLPQPVLNWFSSFGILY